MKRTLIALLGSSILLMPEPVQALSDAAKCASFKLKAAGGYSECLLKEDAKAVKKQSAPDYSKCERKLTIKYTRADLAWECDVEGEVTDVLSMIGSCTAVVSEILGDGIFPLVGVSPGWVCAGPAPDNCESICGDSLVVGDEFCDDGNTTGSDGCSADCLSGCGDGVFDPAEGEECDDGNSATNDGCTPDCIVESCGDGVRQASETCDDFNNDDGDGCSADCQSDETCGNGVVDAVTGEECDGAVLNGANCEGLGHSGGVLSCADDCHFDTSECDQSRWTDNGDGTATDITSGLIWELKTTDGSIHDIEQKCTYNQATGNIANSLNSEPCFGSDCTWRLPTRDELESLVGTTCTTGLLGYLDCTDIPGGSMDEAYYYSSSIDVPDPYDDRYVYVVNMGVEGTAVGYKGASYWCRFVRDPSDP